MRKFSAVLLAILLMFSLNMVVFGEEAPVAEEQETSVSEFLNHQLENISLEKGKDKAYEMISETFVTIADDSQGQSDTVMANADILFSSDSEISEVQNNVNPVSIIAIGSVLVMATLLIFTAIGKLASRPRKGRPIPVSYGTHTKKKSRSKNK